MQNKVVLEYSLLSFVEEIVKAANDGWKLDPNMPPTLYGYSYECGMIRKPTAEQIAKDEEELNKPSRAEILAKARSAKAAKKGA